MSEPRARVNSRPSFWHKTSHQNELFLDFRGHNRVRYVGPGSDDSDAASVRTSAPVTGPFFYFEVEVLNKGHLGFIGVGFVQADFQCGRLPGWASHSYGYHGDDGKAFGSNASGRPYGPLFGKGDVIGAAYNIAERTISYYKNGYDLGIAFENVQEEQLFPCIGLRTPEEEVAVNLGSSPFKANIQEIRSAAASRIRQRIQSTQLPEDRAGSAGLLGNLIVHHLKHCGHFETAAQVSSLIGGSAKAATPAEVQRFRARSSVGEAITTGDIDSAMSRLRQCAPGLLESQPQLLFQLRCQKLVELVRLKDELGAISYGRAEVAGESQGDLSASQRERLMDTLSLLAYDDPAASPHGSLMAEQARRDLAEAVDKAVLQHLGHLQHSNLEHLLRSLVVLAGELKSSKNTAAALADFESMIVL